MRRFKLHTGKAKVYDLTKEIYLSETKKDGSLKAISNNIFIVAPGNIEVTGDLREELVSEDMLSPELSNF